MSVIKWTDGLNVGDVEIDKARKELCALVQELEDVDLSDTFILGIIRRLEKYAEIYLTREEKLMEEFGFPHLEEHIAQHRLFVEWLETVEKTYQRAAESPFQISSIVNDFLENWLVEHIIKEDLKYRDFIINKTAQSS